MSLPFDHTVDIKRRVHTAGAGGGKSQTLSTVSSGVVCFVQPMSAREMTSMKREGYDVDHKIYFLTDPSLGPDNILVWGSQQLDVKGKSYDATVGLERYWRANAKHILD